MNGWVELDMDPDGPRRFWLGEIVEESTDSSGTPEASQSSTGSGRA